MQDCRALEELARQEPEQLHTVYREIAERVNVATAVALYEMFRGQQISFPMHLYDPERVKRQICREFDGKNIRALAKQYGYSEKTIRRMLKSL